MKKSLIYDLIGIGKVILIALVVSIFIENYIIGLTIVNGKSMLYTIEDNDRVLINKIYYVYSNPKRGDIVVFNPPIEKRKEELFIKRIVAVAGDSFKIKGNKIFINGLLLNEDYIYDSSFKERNYKLIEGIVPNDYVFVMGDNRNNSNDSRTFGLVPIENIKGKAITKIWPLRGMKSFAVQYDEEL